MGGVRVLLPVVLPILAGLLLRRIGPLLAALALAGWAAWSALDGAAGRSAGAHDVVRAAAIGAAGGFLLGLAGSLTRRLRRRRLAPRPDGGSMW